MGIAEPITFFSIAADRNPAALDGLFLQRWPSYQTWYLRNDSGRPLPTKDVCRMQLQQHMPELLPTYDYLLQRYSHPDFLAEFLSLYNPPNFVAGCSQAIWNRNGEAALIRNYDFPVQLWSAMQLHTNWNGTRVIAMADCLWGVLDGMNEHGLAVSLSFGGKFKVGDGFSITLVLRYILEFCASVAQAEAVLARMPIAMAYNVTLLDSQGESRIVFVGPDTEAQSTQLLCTTNHQEKSDPSSYLDILEDSNTRMQFLSTRLADKHETLDRIHQYFLQEPLYRKADESKGWGTLYTAKYTPNTGSVNLMWPNAQLSQSFHKFQNCQLKLGN